MNYAPDDEERNGVNENLQNNSLSASSFFSSSGIDFNTIEDTFQVQVAGGREKEGEGEVVYSAEISSNNDEYAIVRLDDEDNSVVTTTTVFWTIYNGNIQNDKDDDDGDKKYGMIKEALLGKMNKCWVVVKEASITTTTTMDDDDNNNTNTNTIKKSFVNNPEELRQAVSSVKVMNNSSLLLDRENNKTPPPPPPPPYFIFAEDDDDTCFINRDAIDISSLKRRYRTNELHCIDDEKESSSTIIYSANLINFESNNNNNNNGKMIFWTIDEDSTNDDNENNNENNDGKDDPFSVIYSAYNDEQMEFIELFNPSDVVTTKLRIITSRIVRSVSHIRNLSSGLLGWLIYDDSKEEEEQQQGRKNEEIIMNHLKKRLSLLSMGLLSGGGWMWFWKANHQPSSVLGYRTIITQFLNDCLYGATTGILSNHTYFQILGESVAFLLFLRFIVINLLFKKLIGRRRINNNSNNDYYFLLKPVGINNPIVQNLSTISIMISNVILLSNSVL
ncbi:hypothetical protein FRACYDRAFT_259409 [Fragilariopsis cylindrus CCMP1102]|uniref:Uncharacterized protein n=1 Tax=Fragilariopsis cylindrus CCMP1102 TaxID=635003 RepID=A0A1E7FZA6_9STRA|nr:hypothetical protein FRACYDRAFT_259409 [Fragilariopsis cylindrus CCMP1102]|eukprot:OEU23492.1 hypothetical protein FRACYDRAFT_259409 [Fragilariopsis cylindrus CCMP1102]